MSPRAAWRLERLGFSRVYDYVGGKMDWLSYALPHEGSALLAGDFVDPSVATCEVDASVADARHRAAEAGGPPCVAVTDGDMVMGILDRTALQAPEERRVEDVMTFGVSTVRPSEDAGALVERMARADVDFILVTSPDARLVGLLRREHTEEALRRNGG